LGKRAENISFICKQKQQHLSQTIFNSQEGKILQQSWINLENYSLFWKKEHLSQKIFN